MLYTVAVFLKGFRSDYSIVSDYKVRAMCIALADFLLLRLYNIIF